jgi:hypothetical protein
MLYEVKADLCIQPVRDEVGANLPQKVVGAVATLAFLPEARPARQVEIHPVAIRDGLLG